MNIFGYSNDPKPWTNPFPERDTHDGVPGADGFLWALRGGDHVHPSGWVLRPEVTAAKKPGWFNAIPQHVRRIYVRVPCLPYVAFRKGRFGCYIGWKAFGVTAPEYKDFPGINPAEVHPESYALQGFTWRFTNKLEGDGNA